MAHNVSVGGFIRYSLVYKAELPIVVDQLFLTRQHKALASLLLGLVDGLTDQPLGLPVTAVLGQ